MTDSTTITLLLPEIAVIASATLLYLVGAFVPLRSAASWLAVMALMLAGFLLYVQFSVIRMQPMEGETEIIKRITASGPLVIDLFGYTARAGILGVGLLLVLLMARSRDFEQSAEEAA